MHAVGRPWTHDEDQLLIAAVNKYGDNTEKWKTIAQEVPGRTNKACRKRWLHSLCPTIKKTAWTQDEDAALLSLYAQNPGKWSVIARGIPGRTDDACSKRYREALDPHLKKDEWTDDEDAKLLEAYGRLGGKWGAIGHELRRSGLGCRNRWRLLERKKAAMERQQMHVDRREEVRTLPPSCPSDPWTTFTPTGAPPTYWDSSSWGNLNAGATQNAYDMSGSYDLLALHGVSAPSQAQPGAMFVSPSAAAGLTQPPSLTPLVESNPAQGLPMTFSYASSSLSAALSEPSPPVQPHQLPQLHSSVTYDQRHTQPQMFQESRIPIQVYQNVDQMSHSRQHSASSLPPVMHARALSHHSMDLSPASTYSDGSEYHYDEQQYDGFSSMEVIQDTIMAEDAYARHAQSRSSAEQEAAMVLADLPAGMPGQSSTAQPSSPLGQLPNQVAHEFVHVNPQPLPSPQTADTRTSANVVPEPSALRTESDRRPRSRIGIVIETAADVSARVNDGQRHPRSHNPPKLSSKLPVASDPSVLAYACGNLQCWPPGGSESATRFKTSGELSNHFKQFHMHDNSGNDFPFRCGLKNCNKGWKSINGLQYHLQISKAHFRRALSVAVSAQRNANTQPPSSNDTANSPTATDSAVPKKKYHPCPHSDCPNQYKQLSGLRYHLQHGHPPTPPAQLDVVPPTIARRVGVEYSQLSPRIS